MPDILVQNSFLNLSTTNTHSQHLFTTHHAVSTVGAHRYEAWWMNLYLNKLFSKSSSYLHPPKCCYFYYWFIGAHHWLSTHVALYNHRSLASTKQNILIYYKYFSAGWLSLLLVCSLEGKVLGSNPTRSINIFYKFNYFSRFSALIVNGGMN